MFFFGIRCANLWQQNLRDVQCSRDAVMRVQMMYRFCNNTCVRQARLHVLEFLCAEGWQLHIGSSSTLDEKRVIPIGGTAKPEGHIVLGKPRSSIASQLVRQENKARYATG